MPLRSKRTAAAMQAVDEFECRPCNDVEDANAAITCRTYGCTSRHCGSGFDAYKASDGYSEQDEDEPGIHVENDPGASSRQQNKEFTFIIDQRCVPIGTLVLLQYCLVNPGKHKDPWGFAIGNP